MRKNDIYVPDCLFPTDNDFEIPTLRLDVQPRACEIPFLCFGEQKRSKDMEGVGTLHFYTDDYRFNGIWEKPEKILFHNPANIVEPNFSLFNETPIAFGMQLIYKKRFLSRSMQEKGIGVFVDLNVANKFYALNLLGVPLGYSSFCTRGYSDRIPSLEFEYNVAKRVANGNNFTFVVYGGGDVVKKWCQNNKCVYVTPIIAIKNKIKALEKISKNVAMIGEDSMKLLSEKSESLYKNQVEIFSDIKKIMEK